MVNNKDTYEWTVNDYVKLQTNLATINSTLERLDARIKTISNSKPQKSTAETLSDWKVLLTLMLTVIGGIMAIGGINV